MDLIMDSGLPYCVDLAGKKIIPHSPWEDCGSWKECQDILNLSPSPLDLLCPTHKMHTMYAYWKSYMVYVNVVEPSPALHVFHIM